MEIHNDFLKITSEMEEMSQANFNLAGDKFKLVEQKFMRANRRTSNGGNLNNNNVSGGAVSQAGSRKSSTVNSAVSQNK